MNKEDSTPSYQSDVVPLHRIEEKEANSSPRRMSGETDVFTDHHEVIYIKSGEYVDQGGTSPLAPWFLNPEFSDVMLYVGQASSPGEAPTTITSFPISEEITYCAIPAHRICLSRLSQFFKACLTNNFEEAREKAIHLPDNPQIFTIFLKALYSNKIVLRRKEVNTDIVKILQMADRYQCDSIVDVVKTHIEKQVRTLEGATKIGSGIIPMDVNFQDLLDLAVCTLTCKFPQFISRLKELNCSKELLLYVLERVDSQPDGRGISSQVAASDLFTGIYEWADAQLMWKKNREGVTQEVVTPKPSSNKNSLVSTKEVLSSTESYEEERRALLTPVLEFVKFDQMTPTQIVKLLKPAKLLPEERLLELLSESVVNQEKIVRVIEYIGTKGYKQPFQNPHGISVTVKASSTTDEPLKGVIGLEPANFWTDHDIDEENRVDPYVEVDFKTRRVVPRGYQFSVLGSCVPMRNWNLEGWCELRNSWDILKVHKNDDSFPPEYDINCTARWDLPWTDKWYRRLRIRCTAPNVDDFKDVVLCCLEIFGKIVPSHIH